NANPNLGITETANNVTEYSKESTPVKSESSEKIEYVKDDNVKNVLNDETVHNEIAKNLEAQHIDVVVEKQAKDIKELREERLAKAEAEAKEVEVAKAKAEAEKAKAQEIEVAKAKAEAEKVKEQEKQAEIVQLASKTEEKQEEKVE